MNLVIKDKSLIRVILVTFLLGVITMAITYAVAITFRIPFKEITGDPALTFQANPLTGIVSNIGVLFWCATSTICFFTGFFQILSDNKKESVFLFFSGLITGILLVDDLFMIHDYIFYALGLNQYVMYSIYIVIFASYFLYFKKRILSSENVLLLMIAFLFLGSSVGLDVLSKNEGIQYFFEDGLKFFGILSWFLYFSATSFYAIKNKNLTIN